MDFTDLQVLQRVRQISRKRQHGIFRVRHRDPLLFDFLIHLAEDQAPASFPCCVEAFGVSSAS